MKIIVTYSEESFAKALSEAEEKKGERIIIFMENDMGDPYMHMILVLTNDKKILVEECGKIVKDQVKIKEELRHFRNS